MKFGRFGSHYVGRLEKGEEIIAVLRMLAVRTKLKGAFFSGLGVGQDLVLGYFDADKKSYVKKLFEGEYEFVSFFGNIAHDRDEIIVHCHATITDRNFNAFGGHLFQATVPVTLEVLIFPLGRSLTRRQDKATALKLIAL